MKKITLFTLLFYVVAWTTAQPSFKPTRGHYKKLSLIDGSALTANSALDSLHFELAAQETRVYNPSQTGEIVGNGRPRTPYYLFPTDTLYIPAPPANSSAQTRAELNYLLQLQTQRSEEDKRASAFYAGVYYRTATKPGDADYQRMQRNLFHIGRSIGTWFNADSLPLTAALTARVWKDAEYLIWKYKNYFIRIRPYKLEPRLQNLEETNWAAYPSGHASNSYVNAYLFAALLPEFEDFFMKDAYDMAHSREIIGVHYPSDSESGRILGHGLIRKLMQNERFKKDFEAAQQEIQKIKTQKGF